MKVETYTRTNAELVRFAAKAKEMGMTYGQLQAQETLNMLKEQKEKEKRKAEQIEMEIKEAIEILKNGSGDPAECKAASAEALHALALQIPKKAMYIPKEGLYKRPYCPTCNCELYQFNFITHRCKCGQNVEE